MKVSFFHDHWLTLSNNQYYTPGGLPETVWATYLDSFNEIVVATRCKHAEKIEDGKFSLSSCKGVSFKPINSYSTEESLILNFTKIRNEIIEVLNTTDCAIVRLPSVIGMIACYEAKKMKKPCAVEVVACAWDSYWNHGSLMGKVMAPIMFYVNKYFIKNTSHAIYVSENFLQKRYPTLGIQSSCSDVSIESISQEIQDNRSLRIDTISENRVVTFGLIGSLNVDYKGHKTAFKALASIKGRIPAFKLRMLGSGDKKRWEALGDRLGIKDSIDFCGTLPNGEPVLQWMDETDVYLIPSLQEGLPRALVEAMSRGCPALGANTGGIPELLPTDCLHKKKDWRKLSEDILHILESKEKLEEYSNQNLIKSKAFKKDILLNRKIKFWSDFKIDAENLIKGIV